MRKRIYIVLSFIFLACQVKQEEKVAEAGGTEQKKVKRVQYYGEPDIPGNDSVITSAGIGKILLADRIEKIDSAYSSVTNYTITVDGIAWPAKKIDLGNGEWIIAEAYNTVGQISKIRTNSPRFASRSGLHVGTRLNEVQSPDELTANPGGKSFTYRKDGIQVEVSGKGNQGQISEMFITCGDC